MKGNFPVRRHRPLPSTIPYVGKKTQANLRSGLACGGLSSPVVGGVRGRGGTQVVRRGLLQCTRSGVGVRELDLHRTYHRVHHVPVHAANGCQCLRADKGKCWGPSAEGGHGHW